jgi:uncharacterized protein
MPKAPLVIEQRPLGRGGHHTSILTLGTSRLARAGQRTAIQVIRESIERGVTAIEFAPEYGDGRVERWLGLALRDGYRERVSLIWQCCAHLRDYKTAMQQFEESLKRLKSHTFEMWSFHEVIYDNDPDWLYDHGGIDAAEEARDQGRVRWIAFGGHKAPHVHKLLNRGFSWDAVIMPLNPFDATFRSFERQVLPEVVRRGAAVIGCKPIAGGGIVESRIIKPDDALRYSWSLPTSTVICSMDSTAIVRKNLKLASNFKPFHAGEMDALRQKARQLAGDGRHERYKTTLEFDGRPGREAHRYPL